MENTFAATPKARLAASVGLVTAELPAMMRMAPPAPAPAPASPFDALPALPDAAWTFLARAWFFIAGTTMGVLFALMLVAVFGRPVPARPAASAASHGSAAGILAAGL